MDLSRNFSLLGSSCTVVPSVMLRVLVDGDLVVFEPTLSICTNCILTLAGVIESFQLENICVTRICFTDVSAVNFQVS